MSGNETITTEKKATKIILMGLSNSGKTSIVLSLQGKTNLLSFYSLKPTKKKVIHKIQMLTSSVNIWDFGGQEQYRNEYLENFDKIIIGTTKIIYVIDVQDEGKYEISLSYFQKIINLLKDKTDIDLSIFIHKFDPDINETHPDIKNNIGDLIQKIKSIIPSTFFYNIFKTSIYTVFSKTIID